MNYICPMFRFATQTFNGGYKSKISVLLVVLASQKLSPPQLEAPPSLNDSLPGLEYSETVRVRCVVYLSLTKSFVFRKKIFVFNGVYLRVPSYKFKKVHKRIVFRSFSGKRSVPHNFTLGVLKTRISYEQKILLV